MGATLKIPLKIMTTNISKSFDGKKFNYFCNGKLYRKSTRDYRFACVASWENGFYKIISLGNKRESTYNSMAAYYRNCKLEVVEFTTI